MPLPSLVSPPPPDSWMPTPYKDREAQVILKLHLLMAWLRTGLRIVMSDHQTWNAPDWCQHVQDELVGTISLHICKSLINNCSKDQVLAHIGVCTVNGFRVQVPYLVKDLCDVLCELVPPSLPYHNTLPGSINMDFDLEEDMEILGQTKDYCYWWKGPGPNGTTPWVTRHITTQHFLDYFNVVSSMFNSFVLPLKIEKTTTTMHMQIQTDGRISSLQNNPVIPGLAACGPPPPWNTTGV